MHLRIALARLSCSSRKHENSSRHMDLPA